ncbi:TPA: hypothetical protein DEP06_01835 [Candidatus Daviesbacteria bacterium]|nr:hypothetical protein [Candidatus Daviesbacteria bacterium]
MLEQDNFDLRRLTRRFVVGHRRKELRLETYEGEPLVRPVRRTVEGVVRWRKDRDGNPHESRRPESRYWYQCNDLDRRQMPRSVFFVMSVQEYWEGNLENYHFAMGAAYWLSPDEERAFDSRKEIISVGWQKPTIGHCWPTQ